MRRRDITSSFDLFLDTVCNTFGGILFIAILIAIQIRHAETSPPPETCSPEKLAELQRRAAEIAAEIDTASVVLETVRKTMPAPIDENDRKLVATYSELLEKKNAVIAKKSDLTRECLERAGKNAELMWELEKIDAKLERLETEESQRLRTVQDLRNEQRELERKEDDARSLVSELETEVAQKTENLRDRDDPDKNSRKEELFLPKLVDAGRLRPFYLVLRFRRLYVVSQRSDFHYTGNRLGVPKRDRGFFVDESDAVKRQIREAIRSAKPPENFIGVFVYGDSVESFHIVRDVVIGAGFRYELIPSPDDTSWSFGGGSGSTQVQ